MHNTHIVLMVFCFFLFFFSGVKNKSTFGRIRMTDARRRPRRTGRANGRLWWQGWGAAHHTVHWSNPFAIFSVMLPAANGNVCVSRRCVRHGQGRKGGRIGGRGDFALVYFLRGVCVAVCIVFCGKKSEWRTRWVVPRVYLVLLWAKGDISNAPGSNYSGISLNGLTGDQSTSKIG